ncbi:MAG TPA: MFS transporter [Caulobacteraceae bacterium]|jgi:AAHS family 4-hydroxybenzoate transporter-like MFS transporter|nr:MFS transporter [Caulobacteraceae bacterium]
MKPGQLDLDAILDGGDVDARRAGLILLCALVAVVDGFDTQSIALVAPVIIGAWRVKAAAFGLVFGAGLFGSLLGALGLGLAADRLGRKPMLALSLAVFAAFTLATPMARTVPVLTAARFCTGLGLGGALPIIISLTSEYAPARLRSTLVSLMFCGFPLGAVLGGFAAAPLIRGYGWASIFYVGGAAPLLLLPLVAAFAPESVRFLALKGRAEAVRKTLAGMGGVGAWNGELGAGSAEARWPVAKLFAEGRGPGTALIWATLFLSLLLTYFLISWIPVIARQSGIDMSSAVLAVAAVNGGAIVGCLAIGALADRSGRATLVIGAAFALGAVAIVLIGQAGRSGAWLLAASFMAGVLSIGAQMCTVAFCAAFYDTPLRATGVGWAIGVGRIGAIVGPVLGGVLLATGMPLQTLFAIVAAMSVGAALGVTGVGAGAARRTA